MDTRFVEADVPATPHTVIDLMIVDDAVYLTLMCYFVRFHIEVRATDLKNDSEDSNCKFHEEFVALCREWEERQEDLEDWIIQPCLPFLAELAPALSKEDVFTLEDYYSPLTYCYRLRTSKGSLIAEPVKTQTAALPQYLDRAAPQLAALDLTQTPQFSASSFEIIRTFEPDGTEYCSIPVKVRRIEGGRHFAFKAVYNIESLVRELEVYSALETVPRGSEGSEACYIPEFHGLLLLYDEVLGFILEYIKHEDTLSSCAANALEEDKVKWFQQVQCTVRDLHQRGLVWGDVKPDNVLIGNDGNAYVLDFGGGHDPEWVDKELCNSEAGDLQGLERIKEFLGC